MSSINEQGFLSKDVDEFVKQNHLEFKDTFDLITDLNRYAQSLMFKINAHDNMFQELLLASLYIRALSSFQSIVILAEKGIESETRVLLRSFMEVMFTLVACCKSKATAEKYVLNDKIDSLKTIRRVKQYKGKSILPNVKKMLKHEHELDLEIKSNDIKRISIEDMSKLAGLHHHYLTVYDVLSRTAHSKVKDIERNLNQDQNRFIWGPKNIKNEYLLLTAASFMIIISDHINDFFDIENSKPLKSFNDRTVKLMKAVGS